MQRLTPQAVPFLAALLLAMPALARPVTDVEGNWSGPVVSKVRVRGVGGGKSTSTDTATVSTGTWSSHNSVGWDYAGTWSASGKKLFWMYGLASHGELEDMLDNWAANEGFPNADSTVTSVKTKAKGRENKRGRKLTIKSIVKFQGFLKGKVRSGKFRSTTRFQPN